VSEYKKFIGIPISFSNLNNNISKSDFGRKENGKKLREKSAKIDFFAVFCKKK
jgi:hypothetical protein